MATNFPTITYARVACYPLQRSTIWKTKVLRFLNDEEQRWVSLPSRQELVLSYTGVDNASFVILKNFFESMHGSDLTTFSLNLGTDPATGINMSYSNLVFTDDDFIATNRKGNLWDVKLRLRAVQ